MSAIAPATVSVSDLQVGMYIHLDLGWMRHPFPLSSFRIASAEQIETIRGLGLHRLRWDPARSELPGPGGPPGSTMEAPPDAPVAGPEVAVAPDPQALARREALARQRAATQRLEHQCTEAGDALRDAIGAVQDRPEQARRDAESLSRALLDKMLVDGDLCIRLMNTQVGDRAAAHGLNVAVIALLLGRALHLPEDDMMDLGVGALFHDVGKIALPDRVRHLEDGFTAAENQAYRDHVRHGVRMGRAMGLSAGALAVLAQHHEHADGSGFPQRVDGDGMGMASHIVALVNRYDNLCNPARLARALTPHEAISVLFAQGRGRFDPTVLNAFIRLMGVYPVGSVVQLTDDRFALVTAVNSSRPLKPRVLVYDPALPSDEALHLELEQQPGLGVRRSLPPAKLPPPALAYLEPRPRVACFFESLAKPEPEPVA